MGRNLSPAYSLAALVEPHGGYWQRFDPRNIPGLVAWYDAASIVANDGDPVASWPDMSGNGFNAIQATPALQPLYRKASPNLLDFNQSTMVTDVLAWENELNAGIARSTAVAAQYGQSILAVTAIAASLCAVRSGRTRLQYLIPITPGKTYTFGYFARADATPAQNIAYIKWFDNTKTVNISTVNSAGVFDTVAGWTFNSITGVAPANAAFISIQTNVNTVAAGELHYFSEFGLFEGNIPAQWVPPVIIPNQRATVQFDGADDYLLPNFAFDWSTLGYTVITAASHYGISNSASKASAIFTNRGGAAPTQWVTVGYVNDNIAEEITTGANVAFGPVVVGGSDVITVARRLGTNNNDLIVNGALRQSLVRQDIGDAASIPRIGRWFSTTEVLPGAIHGIMVYNRPLTVDERIRAERYMAGRYGIAMAA